MRIPWASCSRPRLWAAVSSAWLLIAPFLLAAPAAQGARATDGLVALYPFYEGTGTTVHDASGAVGSLHLEVEGFVSWHPTEPAVVLDGGRIGSVGPATRLIQALKATSQSSLEAWVVPQNTSQSGPAYIVALTPILGHDTGLLGQRRRNIRALLRHTGKTNDGQPRLDTDDNFLTTALTHLVHTFDGANEFLYVDGVQHPTTVTSNGDFSNWDENDLFGIGNSATLQNPWRGMIYLVGLYDRPLSPAEVAANFLAGPAPDLPPAVSAGPDQATPFLPGGPTSEVLLQGAAFDDGLPDPPGALSIAWSVDSGPGNVVFDDPSSPLTTASFAQPGTYVLRLTADDGASSTSDTVRIAIDDPSPLVQAQNVWPAGGAVRISPNPTLELACDPAVASESHFLIASDEGFASVVYDSGPTPLDPCAHVALADLAGASQHWWSARLRGPDGAWSAWSAPTSFTTVGTANLSRHELRDGLDGYAGAADADIRGSAQNPMNAIREWNQGAQSVLRIGRRPAGQTTDEIYRTLLRFELPSGFNAGEVVNAYLELTGWQHAIPQVFSYRNASLHRLLVPWNEGESVVNTPVGEGEVSWTYSEYPIAWNVPGAAGLGTDREAIPVLRGRATNTIGEKTRWSSEGFTELVRQWIIDPESNFGLVMQADDEMLQHDVFSGSREVEDPFFRPALVIETAPLPKKRCGLGFEAGLALVALMKLRFRRQRGVASRA
jgi:hypothetical protein